MLDLLGTTSITLSIIEFSGKFMVRSFQEDSNIIMATLVEDPVIELEINAAIGNRSDITLIKPIITTAVRILLRRYIVHPNLQAFQISETGLAKVALSRVCLVDVRFVAEQEAVADQIEGSKGNESHSWRQTNNLWYLDVGFHLVHSVFSARSQKSSGRPCARVLSCQCSRQCQENGSSADSLPKMDGNFHLVSIWSTSFYVLREVDGSSHDIDISVYNHEPFGKDQLIGRTALKLQELADKGVQQNEDLLVDLNGKPVGGSIIFSTLFQSDGAPVVSSEDDPLIRTGTSDAGNVLHKFRDHTFSLVQSDSKCEVCGKTRSMERMLRCSGMFNDIRTEKVKSARNTVTHSASRTFSFALVQHPGKTKPRCEGFRHSPEEQDSSSSLSSLSALSSHEKKAADSGRTISLSVAPHSVNIGSNTTSLRYSPERTYDNK